jgi:galactarate dehydratase
MSMVESILRQAETHLQRLNARRRETVPASELVVGVQCGGSDAFSGVTANPAVGFCTDLLVRAGASVMFSETTEVRDGIDQLTARAATPRWPRPCARDGLVRRLPAARQRGPQRQHHARQQEGRAVQHRRKGHGLHRQVRLRSDLGRALAGRKADKPEGPDLCGHPASDFICGTLQLAAGMNLHVFTTGRGTPYGLAECPVIKVATRSDLARRWHDLMDVNAGTIADGKATIEEVGWELFHLMLDVASGRKKTWAEHWKLHNALVLFNPAPVT